MRSSTTPPVASSQHSVYCACPGAIRARSLVSVALTKSRAPRPRTTPLPRWLTSKIPTACRTAACSLSTPPSGYSIGISQPPKSAILAPRPTWRSYSGEWYSGGPAAAAAAEAIMRTDASASPATSAGDKRHCIDVAPGRLAGPCPCWSLPGPFHPSSAPRAPTEVNVALNVGKPAAGPLLAKRILELLAGAFEVAGDAIALALGLRRLIAGGAAEPFPASAGELLQFVPSFVERAHGRVLSSRVGSDRLAGSATRRCRLTAKLDLGAKTGSRGSSLPPSPRGSTGLCERSDRRG